MHSVASHWLTPGPNPGPNPGKEPVAPGGVTLPPRWRRWAQTVVKCLVTAAILGYAATDAARHGLLDHVRTISPFIACLALLPFMAIPVLGGLRWWCVLRGMGAPAGSPVTLATLFSVATIFGQFLPSVASDGLRGWLAIRHGYGGRETIHAIVFERGTMILSLLVLLVLTQPVLAARIGPFAADWIAPVLLGIGAAATVTLVLADQRSLRNWQIFRPVAAMSADAHRLSRSRWGLAAAALSMVSNLNFVLIAALLAQATGLPLTWIDCLAVIPLVTVATTLPISFGGWGVREGVLIALLGAMGVPAGGAFVLSVLFGVGGAISGLPGFVIWWLDPATVWPGKWP